MKSFKDPSLHLEFSKILDGVSFCFKKHEHVFSDFLDPYKAEKFVHVLSCAKNLHIHVSAFGGFEACERKILGLSPEDMALSERDFPIVTLDIIYHAKFSRTLGHRDFLGSVLGLSIERGNVGDIVLKPGGALVLLKRKIAGYVCDNLSSVGHTGVKTVLKPLEDVVFPVSEKQIKRVTVPSLRLDGVVSAAFRLSRSKSAALIHSEKVFVNWLLAPSVSKLVSEKDVITVRGLGRVEICEIAGQSKKDRIVLEIAVFEGN